MPDLDKSEFSICGATLEQDVGINLTAKKIVRLHDADRQAIVDALPNYLARIGISFEEFAIEGLFEANPQLLISRLRLHIRADDLTRDMIKRVVRVIVLVALLGTLDPKSAFAGLTADLALSMYQSLTLLDQNELRVVEVILSSRALKPLSFPTATEIQRGLPSTIDVLGVLNSLAGRSVIKEICGGWDVAL